MFSLDRAGLVEGLSGGYFFTSKTGFGYAAKGSGNRSRELLVAVRGTSSLCDCITDINISAETGTSGHLVHTGFHRTFKSFQPELNASIDKMKPTGVHVVGHSLGGALATMIADMISGMGIEAKVYTFGAPRIGMSPHSLHLTNALPEQNIYRVYHSADPVAMLPIFPFRHAPVTSSAYYIPSSGRIDYHAHFLDNYIASIKDQDWKNLSGLSPAPKWKQQSEDFLKVLDSNHGIRMLSAASWWVLLRSLETLLEETEITVGSIFYGGATILDQLAQLLYKGYLTSARIADKVKCIMAGILKFLGHPGTHATNVTVAFISWLLTSLFAVISNAAVRALHIHDVH